MTAGQLLAASLVDAVVGDPRWLPHPVRCFGRGIAWYDRTIRGVTTSPLGERLAGVAVAVMLPAMAFAGGWAGIALSGSLHATAGMLVAVWMASTTLAARDLADHARAVRAALLSGSLEHARKAVGCIVGRDTAELSESEVVRATVETVAESTSDGVVAPLFYLIVGGPPLALAYKAINTLDSMLGHRDLQYGNLGWASARLDDAANWVPARITAGTIAFAATFLLSRRNAGSTAWRILRRDGHKHPSPNSGRPEAAMAGALGVQLGGTNFYHGLPSPRPLLGDDAEPLTPAHIDQAVRLMSGSTAMAVVLGATLLAL